MVGKALRRGGLIAALLVAGAGLARADDLCARLTVPPELGLACAPKDPVDSAAGVAVAPTGGAFAILSQLSLRRLDKAADPLAWSDPDEWLRRQVVVDTTAIGDLVEGLADDPDSPWGGPTAMLLAETIRQKLEQAGRAALSSCAPPADRDGERTMSCRLGATPLMLLLELRLVSDGDTRWALTWPAMNEQRQRHFTAIANSFRPG